MGGTLSDLTITAPDGTVTHGVYMEYEQGVSYYEVCAADVRFQWANCPASQQNFIS